MTPKQRRDLRRAIDEQFSKAELRTLTKVLKFSWERLAGDDKLSKIHSLLKRVQRGRRAEELFNYLQKERPDAVWNTQPPDDICINKPAIATKKQSAEFQHYLNDLELFIEEGYYSDTSIAMVQSLTDSAWPAFDMGQKQIAVKRLIDGKLLGLLTHYQRDMSDLDLRRTDLVHANLNNAILRRALLNGADLSEAYLITADLRFADLNRADLIKANLRNATLHKANFFGANLSQAKLQNATLSDADLRCADLSQANLRDADLTCADLREANLSKVNLRGANLSHASLVGANLTAALLLGANLSHADLRGADLSSANLQNADLSNAIVHGALQNQTGPRGAKRVEANHLTIV